MYDGQKVSGNNIADEQVKRTMKEWHVGCSGFHYKHWRPAFYPEKLAMTKWFNFYQEHFDTVELNVTFYRFPQLPFVQAWYKKATSNFRFSVKAPKAITHYKKFIDCDRMLSDFYTVVKKGLKEKLGCVLFQLPPKYDYKEERLERILSAMDPRFKNVLEFRHSSWWNDTVYKTLAEKDVTFCGMSHPLLPDTIVKNAPILYYRLHGVPYLYKSLYSENALKEIADEIKRSRKVKEVYLYFNNDIDASAINNATFLKNYVSK
jgi:uncharacterized protein YecE (DUF72 family)